jgi:hypothetical protein
MNSEQEQALVSGGQGGIEFRKSGTAHLPRIRNLSFGLWHKAPMHNATTVVRGSRIQLLTRCILTIQTANKLSRMGQ